MARHYAQTRFPSNPSELGAALADPQRFGELFPDAAPGAWDDFESSYAAASPMYAERLQLAQQDALRASAGRIPQGLAQQPGSGRHGRFYSDRAPGTVVDKLFAGDPHPLGSFMQVLNPHAGDEAQTLRGRIFDAMSERIPAEGGFLVPEIVRDSILTASLESAIVRPRAMPITMDSLRVPLPVTDDTSHVSSVFGGVTGYWTEEGAALQATAPSFGRTVLEARKLTMYTTIPNELFSDAPNLEPYLMRVWPQAIAFYEDVAFLTGTGTGEPQGIVNAPGAISLTRQTSTEIQYIDVVNMISRVYPAALPGVIWVASPDTIPQLLQLAVQMTPGTATTSISPPVWLMEMNAANDMPTTLLGKEIIFSEKVGPLGSLGDLMLVNFGWYVVGDRQSLQVATSDEYLFANDMTAYRMIERLDGRAWLQSPISPYNGSAKTLSFAVLLH